jgi:HK97 family phage portal protein
MAPLDFFDVVRAMGLNIPPAKDDTDPSFLRVVGSTLGGFAPQPKPDDFTDQMKAFRVSALVFRCAQLWAEAFMQAPVRVWRRRNRRMVEEITSGPVWSVLEEINGVYSMHEWMYINIVNLALTGNAYTWKVRSRQEKVVELWPLRPDEIEIAYDPTFDPRGKLRYDWRPVSTGGFTGKGGPWHFKSSSILHLRLPSPLSPVFGQGPVRPSHDDILADQQAKRTTLSWLANDGVPAGVLQTDQTLTQDQAELIKERWRESHVGPDRRGKVAVLGAGTKFVPIVVTPKDIEWLNQRKLSRAGILTAFGVPPIYAGMEGENFANRKEQRMLFWQDTIRPKLRLIEAQLTEFLMRDFDPEYVWVFDENKVDAFIDLIAGRMDAAVTAADPMTRIMKPYEVRQRLLGIEERYEGDDKWFVPTSLVTDDIVLEGKTLPQFGPPPGFGGFPGAGAEGPPQAEGGAKPPEGEKPPQGAEKPVPTEKDASHAARRLAKLETSVAKQRRLERLFVMDIGQYFGRLSTRVKRALTAGRAPTDVIDESTLARIMPPNDELAEELLGLSKSYIEQSFMSGYEEGVNDQEKP